MQPTHYVLVDETKILYHVGIGKTYVLDEVTNIWNELDLLSSYKILHSLIKIGV